MPAVKVPERGLIACIWALFVTTLLRIPRLFSGQFVSDFSTNQQETLFFSQGLRGMILAISLGMSQSLF
jgi:hypothetical protein